MLIVCSVSADVLAPVGARTSASTLLSYVYIYIYIYIWDWHIKKATYKKYLQFLSFVNIMGVQSVQVHPMDDKNLSILHSKYHASWCTGPLHDWGWGY